MGTRIFPAIVLASRKGKTTVDEGKREEMLKLAVSKAGAEAFFEKCAAFLADRHETGTRKKKTWRNRGLVRCVQSKKKKAGEIPLGLIEGRGWGAIKKIPNWRRKSPGERQHHCRLPRSLPR